MREVSIRVREASVEAALDRLLPLVPDGVRELPDGELVALVARGPRVPSAAELRRALGPLALELTEAVVSDDWRERRRADLRPVRIAGRVAVIPDWAPPTAAMDEIVIRLGEGPAFGTGTHPTTVACLELLLTVDGRGSFGDLGCGSGVLAILAEKLGFEPVQAVDVQVASVAAARLNADRNGATVAVTCRDAATAGARHCDVIAANVPPAAHRALVAGGLRARAAVVSGLMPVDASGVLAAYRAHGLGARTVIERDGWVAALLVTDVASTSVRR